MAQIILSDLTTDTEKSRKKGQFSPWLSPLLLSVRKRQWYLNESISYPVKKTFFPTLTYQQLVKSVKWLRLLFMLHFNYKQWISCDSYIWPWFDLVDITPLTDGLSSADWQGLVFSCRAAVSLKETSLNPQHWLTICVVQIHKNQTLSR